MSLRTAFIGQIQRALTTVTAAASLAGLSLVSGAPAYADAVVNCGSGDLQAAIDTAVENAAGTTPTLTVSGFCEGNFAITGDLNIQGAPGAVLDAGHAGAVVTITGAKVRLSNLIIRNGANEQHGGGINVDDRSSLTLTASRVTGNSATEGGGIYDEGFLTIKSSLITGNNATYGGGIYSNDGLVDVSNSHIARNQAGVSGGGIVSSSAGSGTLTLTSSVVSGNTSGAGGVGGGIYNTGGSPLTLNYTLVALNRAKGDGGGGGVYNSSGPVTLNSSPVVANIPNNCFNC
ncbi:hypothetical protein [Streptomyces sp. NPDC047028]|uniref:hypothetical protein n=1 Tax=Streptomyces sp. NPDC047028 TaxID=3155793 RepID=UPI00340DE6B4